MSIQRLEELTGYNTPILRALPNVNVEITAGMTAIHANEQLNEAQTKQVVGLFEAIGSVSEQPEDKFSRSKKPKIISEAFFKNGNNVFDDLGERIIFENKIPPISGGIKGTEVIHLIRGATTEMVRKG